MSPPAKRVEMHDAGEGFYRVVLHYGFMEEVDIPRDLAGIKTCGAPFDMMRTSFFLGRQKLIASKEQPGMPRWREKLFAWMLKNSESAMEFFKLPTNRVVENSGASFRYSRREVARRAERSFSPARRSY